MKLQAFRRDELMEFDVRVERAPATEPDLKVDAAATNAVRRLRSGWLGDRRETRKTGS